MRIADTVRNVADLMSDLEPHSSALATLMDAPNTREIEFLRSEIREACERESAFRKFAEEWQTERAALTDLIDTPSTTLFDDYRENELVSAALSAGLDPSHSVYTTPLDEIAANISKYLGEIPPPSLPSSVAWALRAQEPVAGLEAILPDRQITRALMDAVASIRSSFTFLQRQQLTRWATEHGQHLSAEHLVMLENAIRLLDRLRLTRCRHKMTYYIQRALNLTFLCSKKLFIILLRCLIEFIFGKLDSVEQMVLRRVTQTLITQRERAPPPERPILRSPLALPNAPAIAA